MQGEHAGAGDGGDREGEGGVSGFGSLNLNELTVFEMEHASGADLRADAAADAGGARKALIGLCVRADVDAHFAVFGAEAAGDAHVLFDLYPVTAGLLDEAE